MDEAATNPQRIVSIQSLSFWQQDQQFWSQAQSQAQSQSQSAALIDTMSSALTTESQGLASIANQQALTRTNSALTAAVQAALQQSSTSSTGSSSTGSSSTGSTSSSGSASSGSGSSGTPTPATPATGTGTVPLTNGTSLLTLGIPQNGDISVSDGTNTTTYVSTGSDTVGDLLNAINTTDVYGNAQVNAYLNPSGNLVITAQNTTDPVLVSGTFASNIGFGVTNDSFEPTAASSSSTSSSNGAGSTGASSGSGTPAASGTTGSTSSSASTSGSSSTLPAASLFNSAYQLQTGGTAELLLASSGSSGTLLNLLA